MLTNGEIEELKAFFASPMSASLGHTIAAQSYEPRGKQGYDPSTDTKLASLVFRGVEYSKSAWARMKRVLDQLSAVHVEGLRLLANGDVNAIACRTPRAIEAGRRVAREARRLEHLEEVMRLRVDRQSPMTTAMRVLEEDRLPFPMPTFTRLELVYAARHAIDDGLVDVDEETTQIVTTVVKAFRGARAEMKAWRATASEREDKRRVEFRDSLRAKREEKERSRFERALSS